MKVIGALPEDGRASTAPTLASLGINELPLFGHYVPEGVDTNSCAQSRIAAIGRKKQGMPTGLVRVHLANSPASLRLVLLVSRVWVQLNRLHHVLVLLRQSFVMQVVVEPRVVVLNEGCTPSRKQAHAQCKR